MSAAYQQTLGEAGYVAGKTLTIEYRWAEGQYDRLPALAADLVSRNADVIATAGGATTALAAQRPPRRHRPESSSSWATIRFAPASSPA